MALRLTLFCLAFSLAIVSCAPVSGSFKASEADLHRASTQVPRNHFKGAPSLVQTNKVLNGHLSRKASLATKACESFDLDELQQLSRALFMDADTEMLSVYSRVKDNRRQIFDSIDSMEREFKRLLAHAVNNQELLSILRDGMCHRVVMWFIHHLPEEKQQELAQVGLTIPLLPNADHTRAQLPQTEAAQQIHAAYNKSVTCQKCHVGGIHDLGVNEVYPSTAKQLARRCYTNYQELFNITCGPCDGVAGAYWGDDDDKYFTPDPCQVVAQPDAVAEADRVQPVFPPQFSVSVVAGSDRWGRTTNPLGHVKTPFPPIIDSMYGQITGNWFMDTQSDPNLWMLRHDTAYAHVAFNGSHIPLVGFHVSEIHAQTKAQQAVNNTGPMVSLISGIPDMIPGGCTCVADPVGVPDQAHQRTEGLAEMEYLGRIKLTIDEHKSEVVELDHWANWFFHVFMDVDKSVPHYAKAPRRLASAYAGTATYDNWVLADPKIADPTVWTRGIPVHPERVGPDHGKYCMNPQKIDMCNNISSTTFPPTPQAQPAAQSSNQLPWETIHKHFLPSLKPQV